MLIFILALWPIIELSKKLRGSAAEVQAHTGKLTSDLKESFSGARMIKAYGLESYEDKRLGTEFDTRIRLFLRLVTQQAWVEPILTVLGGLVIAGVITFGVWQVVDERTQPETIVAILTGVMILAPRLRALGTLNNVVQEGLAALTRIFGVIDETPAITDADRAVTLSQPKGHVKLENACFSYGDGTEALRGVSLEAKPGRPLPLLGRPAAANPPLSISSQGLYDVSAGQVCIDGTDVRHLTLASLRGAMALVSQDVTLFDDTVAANIGFGDQSAGREDIINAAQAADAHDFIIALPPRL